jgi:hypothetical protein
VKRNDLKRRDSRYLYSVRTAVPCEQAKNCILSSGERTVKEYTQRRMLTDDDRVIVSKHQMSVLTGKEIGTTRSVDRFRRLLEIY